jgi:kynurenine formamidase
MRPTIRRSGTPMLVTAGLLLSVCGTTLSAQQPANQASIPSAEQLRQSNRYGGNPLGAFSEVTPAKTQQAAQLIREGKIYDLAMDIVPGAPAFPPRYFNHSLIYNNVYPTGQGKNDFRWSDELVTGYLGTFTQLDCLGHGLIGEHLYGGRRWRDIAAPTGLKELGCETLKPVLTRGIVLDIAGLKGVQVLDPTYEITVADIEGAMRRQNIRAIEPGDAVIFHTGWMSVYHSDPQRWIKTEPGIGVPAARWLAARRVAAVGADTWGIDQFPSSTEGTFFHPHQVLIAENGIPLMENVVTADLVRDGVSEFALAITHTPVKGAGQTWGTFAGYR